jgi:voltage-gated potassium channel
MIDALRLPLRLGLLGAVYYLLPVFEPVQDPRFWLRGLLAVALVGLVGTLVTREVLAEVQVGAAVHLDRLLLAVVGGVLLFALADFIVSRTSEGQFVGMETKTDALYFAVTTLATVGYGDVHAEGQLARALVIGQMLFNFVVIASAARLVTRELGARRTRAARPDDDEQ